MANTRSLTRYYCPKCGQRGASTPSPDISNTPLCHRCDYKIRMVAFEFESDVPPPDVLSALREAMDYLLENARLSPPGSVLPRKFGGYDVTLRHPAAPGEPYETELRMPTGRVFSLKYPSYPTHCPKKR